jgi:hypothetical protein
MCFSFTTPCYQRQETSFTIKIKITITKISVIEPDILPTGFYEDCNKELLVLASQNNFIYVLLCVVLMVFLIACQNYVYRCICLVRKFRQSIFIYVTALYADSSLLYLQQYASAPSIHPLDRSAVGEPLVSSRLIIYWISEQIVFCRLMSYIYVVPHR